MKTNGKEWIVLFVLLAVIGVVIGFRKDKQIKTKQVLIDSIKVDSLTFKIYMKYGKED